MTIHISFLELFLFVLTIVTIIVAVYLVGFLKQFRRTLETINDIVAHSQAELTSSLKNVEQITDKVEDISQQVNTIVSKVSSITNSADKLLQPLGSLLAGVIQGRKKSHSA